MAHTGALVSHDNDFLSFLLLSRLSPLFLGLWGFQVLGAAMKGLTIGKG